MARGDEVEEKVDLEEDNYMEETDEEVEIEEQIEVEEEEEVEVEEEVEEEEEEEPAQGSGDEREDSRDNGVQGHEVNAESSQDKQKLNPSLTEEEKQKYKELLALPPHGSEVFIGGLPKDASEDDLRDLCEPIGEVVEIKLVKDKDTHESKGFAFMTFESKQIAQNAIQKLHSKEFKGKTLRCSASETKNRLFIGNVPKSWTDEQFREVFEKLGPGIELIELIKDPQNPTRNRGFAFILYYNNACADYSRQKMVSPNFKLDGNTPSVSWADPKGTPPDQSAAAAQVKAVYVKNIPDNTTTAQVKELFQRHGEVTKVVMPPGKSGKRDFAFVHYAERTNALKAVNDTEKYEINGQVLEVVLAKPQNEKKPEGAYPYGAVLQPAPIVYPAYGTLGAGFGVPASFNQPTVYGRGAMPTGMQMVPMVLPDGRVGYVLQQPGVVIPQPRPPRADRSSGHGRGARSGDDSGRSKRYRPY